MEQFVEFTNLHFDQLLMSCVFPCGRQVSIFQQNVTNLTTCIYVCWVGRFKTSMTMAMSILLLLLLCQFDYFEASQERVHLSFYYWVGGGHPIFFLFSHFFFFQIKSPEISFIHSKKSLLLKKIKKGTIYRIHHWSIYSTFYILFEL